MFEGCSSLKSINLSNFNTNNLVLMNRMFKGYSQLTSIDLSNFNCDNIKNTKDMEDMFKDCQNLKFSDVKNSDFKIRSQIINDLKL